MPRRSRDDRRKARLLTDDWESLSDSEKVEVLELTREAGRLVAVAWFGEEEDQVPDNPYRPLRPTGPDHPNDQARMDCESLEGLPNPPFFANFVLKLYCPERVQEFRARWRKTPDEILGDLRVCFFCDGFERERRRIEAEPALPTGRDELFDLLIEQREDERELAREWYSFWDEGPEDEEAPLLRLSYREAWARTDQLQMLVEAAQAVDF